MEITIAPDVLATLQNSSRRTRDVVERTLRKVAKVASLRDRSNAPVEEFSLTVAGFRATCLLDMHAMRLTLWSLVPLDATRSESGGSSQVA